MTLLLEGSVAKVLRYNFPFVQNKFLRGIANVPWLVPNTELHKDKGLVYSILVVKFYYGYTL